jgi:tRNA U38,U39,U40 pseudouridine synthase TruA
VKLISWIKRAIPVGSPGVFFFNPNFNPRSDRLRRIYKYLAVPRSLVSCCKCLLLPLCHDRGREFESRQEVTAWSFPAWSRSSEES